MSDEYTIFIDESGDEGLSGKSSQMFCLGAFIIKNDEYDEILNNLNNIKKVLKKQELHATHIKNHISKVFICKEIAKMPITAFGLISNKSSLGNYNIKEHWKYTVRAPFDKFIQCNNPTQWFKDPTQDLDTYAKIADEVKLVKQQVLLSC